ncbi:MAG: hypothetical protein IJG45_04845 [Oscillospiraceae bacterium]|nr:hypothetical protein [Oscillospiraceae bacterium]
MKRIAKKRAAAKWILLALLVYCLVITALTYLLPDSRTAAILCPFTLVAVYLEQWTAESAAIVVISRILVWLFAALPLVGWFLLCKPVRAGKTMIVAPYCLLLACNLWITLSHLITGLGIKNTVYMAPTLQYVSITLRLFAVSLVISVAVLVSVCFWQPKKT